MPRRRGRTTPPCLSRPSTTRWLAAGAAVTLSSAGLVGLPGSPAAAAPAPSPVTSFEDGQAQPDGTVVSSRNVTGPSGSKGMQVSVGKGPATGYNIRREVGFTGVKAVKYAGTHAGAGRASSRNRLFATSVRVTPSTQLSYKVFPLAPEKDGAAPTEAAYAATHVALDLHFTDGTSLSGLRATDHHGVDASAAGQGRGKILYANQWNSVTIDVGKVARGKTIDRVDLSYDNPAGEAKAAFEGWVDDVSVRATTTRIDGSNRVNYVDTRRGTNSDGGFSRGNNLPISAVPNGFTFFTPATDANSRSWQYVYSKANDDKNRPVLQGLNISHEPSPWMGDRNQVSFMPSIADGAPSGKASDRGLAFDHATEVAQPHYYKAELAGGVRAEHTPADHGGVMRFTYPATAKAGKIILDTVDDSGSFTIGADKLSFTGWVDSGSGLSAGRSRMFVYGTFSAPVTQSGSAPGSHQPTQYVAFDTTRTRSVEMHVATSLISLAQAQKNHALELAGKNFEAVKTAANAAWDERLGVVDVKADNDTQLQTLYSNLYRLNLYPNSQSENTGTAAAPRWRFASPVNPKSGAATATTTNAEIRDGMIYVNNGFWDTYRTAWPAYTLLYPEVAGKIADGFVQQYRSGGWIARWSSPGYADLMTGTSSDVSFADAYVKGVNLPDPMNTYLAAVKNATVVSGRSEVGRKGLSTSTFLGFTSRSTGESVSWGLEGHINDYGIGNMAAALAKGENGLTPAQRARLREESAYFLLRAKNYVNLFNPATSFFQGRDAGGSFSGNFNPLDWGGDYTETNAWNFAFHAPHDGGGLANLYGGRAGLEKKLDQFFATPETATHPGGYGGVIHEIREAAAVRMGQYGASNQPSHHIPYMYNYAGAQYKTAAKVREVLRRMYVGGDIGQGYPGDEDNGEMSSWHLLSSLGLYPLQVGSSKWAVGSPKFTQATVHRPQGDLVVNAPGNSETNVYVQSLKVNGKAQTSSTIDQGAIAKRTVLTFAMGPKPSAFGTKPADLPPSLTKGTAKPVALEDATGPSESVPTVGTTSTSRPVIDEAAKTDGAPLFDNNAGTAVTFSDATPTVAARLTGLAQKASWYTLTSGPNAGDPSGWMVQGSNDGAHWATLDTRKGQTFTWRNQTRPFRIAKPGVYRHYRLVVTQTSGAATPNLSEVEFLTDGSESQAAGLSVTGASALADASTGRELTLPLATFAGGDGAAATDYKATVDWGDGTKSDASVAPGRLGAYQVVGKHTYAKGGAFQVTVTVTDKAGATADASTAITVHPTFRPAYTAAFTSTCIVDDGTPNNCDLDGAGLSRQALAAAGAVPGKLLTVPGTDLRWSLPTSGPGLKDNADGEGQVLKVDLAPGATQLSLIGFGTQGSQDTTGTVTFTDGTTAPYKIQLTDWCAAPQFGNVVAVKTGYRINGSGTDGCQAQLFATAPFTIPAGKTVASVTLAKQTGNPRTDGRGHVVAVADNGAAMKATPGAAATASAGTAKEFTLATLSAGSPAKEGYTARVSFGDGTATQDATVTMKGDTAVITGSHTYAAEGTYTVRVLAADTASDALLTTTVTVGAGR